MKKQYSISGKVLESANRFPVSGARVEAWDKDLLFDDLVGSATTDQQGAFNLRFDESYYNELFFDRRPDLFFRVFYNEKLVLDTRSHVLWNLEQKDHYVELLVEAGLVGLPDGNTLLPSDGSLSLGDVGSLISIDEATLEKLKARNIPLEEANEAALNNLLEEGVINAGQKKDIQLVATFARIGGSNPSLIAALKLAAPESIGQLIGWDKNDWFRFIQDQRVTVPADESNADVYAENIRYTMEQSFPSQYFLHRVVNSGAGNETGALIIAVAPLFDNNTVIIPDDLDDSIEYDWKDVSTQDRQAVEAGISNLVPLAHSYRALGVVETINDPQLDAPEKLQVIGNRFTALSTFYQNNPQVELESADFVTSNSETGEDRWNWSGIDEAHRPYVKKQMAASQRTFLLAGEHETGNVLMKKGYNSASQIAAVSEERFLSDTGISLEKGKAVYEKAKVLSASSSHYFEAIRDAVRGTFRDIAMNNQDARLVNDLKEIDGYADLFGNQDFCDCAECRSILSPAAYFADLMYFVHQHVSKNVFLPAQAAHPLYLKNRRPDLWKLKLSCKNTNTEIPYLQVVNEVLESYLEGAEPTSDVYETLRTADRSCRQPFNLRLEETRLYLSHFGLRLPEIYKALKRPVEEQYREQLLLSVEELAIISTPNTAGAHKRFRNIPFANFDVQEFIRLAGITRGELDQLLAATFSSAFSAVHVKVIKLGTDIQKYHEVLTGLTANNLDVIHRYLRLWKKTSWTLREFDLVLNAMKSRSLLSTLEEMDSGKPKLLQLARVIGIQQQLSCSPEELATLLYRFPLKGLTENAQSFYSRMFDLEKLFGTANAGASTTTTLPADKTSDKITPLIIAGLGISQSELQMLFGLLHIDTTVDQSVNIDLLSSLYRHALIARGLKLGIEDFVHLTSLINGYNAITTLDQIDALAAAVRQQKASPFSVSEIRLILEGKESSDLLFTNDLHAAATAVLDIQAAVNADNKDAKELLKIFLQRTFNLTAKQLDEDYLLHLTPCDLAGAGITAALNAPFTDGVPDTPADLKALVDLLQALERYALLFGKARIDAEMATFLVRNKAVAGIASFTALRFVDFVNVLRYHELFANRDALRPGLFAALQQIQTSGFHAAERNTLAAAWEQPESILASLTGALTFPAVALEAIDYLHSCLAICVTLGIQGDALLKLKNSDKAGLEAARNVVLGAFASKYPNETVRLEKATPYTDKLNTLKRDALCDYIISRSDVFKFKDRNDLYNFFLLDVEMSGCFRTSYLVAAITSVQLYVHRCLINLEQSDANLNPDIADMHVSPGLIPADEWEWRKNYRVWEANRKVFLYPENYIDPALRDNKTEIFKELEEELLQQKITHESAEAAYKKYLAQFAELSRLRYGGGFYHHISSLNGFLNLSDAKGLGELLILLFLEALASEVDSEDSKFHLFARTNVQPYRYYHRTYNHYKKVWTSWKKIDLTIEAAEISAIMFQGKLYIYWTESQGKETSKISGGNTVADGMIFKTYVKYSFLNEHGKWSAPQRLYTGHTHVNEETLFRRVRNGAFPSDDVREKTHDSTVEKFQELVFRKPYAVATTNVAKPIKLHHLWSQNKSQTKIRYNFNSIHQKSGLISFNLPPFSFTVTNGEFGAAVQSVYGTLTYFSSTVSVAYYVRLHNSSYCTISLSINGSNILFPAYVSSWQIVAGTAPKYTTSETSLSRNAVLNLPQDDLMTTAYDASYMAGLAREYQTAFTENNEIGFYVENGRDAMSNHHVYQSPQNDAFLFVQSQSTGVYDTVTLSTVLTDELGDILFSKGLKEFLALKTQQLTDEHGQQFDLKGAYGDYYWEMFFHIPFLVADHLNANQKFKEAKWWYERIFDPTAEEKPGDATPTEHNWQFREFRNLKIDKLKDILADQKAIEAYKNDPFNPHAIARLRLSAYQKTVVMHYVDNLLDWGDYLFMQDTRESINEAEMLYQLAFDILGKRPVKVGKCETADEDTLTYATIEPQFRSGSEFLIQLENYVLVQKNTWLVQKEAAKVTKGLDAILDKKIEGQKSLAQVAKKASYTTVRGKLDELVTQISNPAGEARRTDPFAVRAQSYKKTKAQQQANRQTSNKWIDAQDYVRNNGRGSDKIQPKPIRRLPGYDLVKQYSLAFCVPANAELMKYWDRVEDRLFKIRNCMNISGVRRSLSLFQPPIDPMLLVRARAAGLSLEDIGAMIAASGQLPVYRFTYLVEKAKQLAQTVQSFGSALLSALDKKDGEELLLLRTVHEKNILKMTRNVKMKQHLEAQQQYKAASAALINVQNRVDYYRGLLNTGLIPWEVAEQVSKWTASGIRITEATLGFLASAFGYLPQIGSPFAMKYGGVELKNGMSKMAYATGTLAAIADNVAILAGLEGSHQRRAQEWAQQLRLAEQELQQSGFQVLAADYRQQIVGHELDIHDKNMEQTDEVLDFHRNKFTGLSLYNYLASTLNRLYRQAYNVAYDLAKQAEAAYRFERFDEEIYIQADNWQFDRAGLLAGERLLLQLSQLEKKYIESNVRLPEITQTFSLSMLSPSQLLRLRATGQCTISIPEIAFEALYPGQYRRVIKSVRMTIPCIAGQYTNVAAKLTLTKGSIEHEDGAAVAELLVGKGNHISTSSANNDTGMFDFNFRDERYLPFEGAGAISEWLLELPSSFRSFNYDTISDVLLHISYTAYEGNRETAEAALSATISAYAGSTGFYRLISLKHEFPEAFHKLFSQPAQSTSFAVTKSHFPYVLTADPSKHLSMFSGSTMVYIKPVKGATATVPGTVKVNGNNAVDWTDANNNMPAGTAAADQVKGGVVSLTGDPVKTWTIDAGNNGIDKNTTDDVLIVVRYKVV